MLNITLITKYGVYFNVESVCINVHGEFAVAFANGKRYEATNIAEGCIPKLQKAIAELVERVLEGRDKNIKVDISDIDYYKPFDPFLYK